MQRELARSAIEHRQVDPGVEGQLGGVRQAVARYVVGADRAGLDLGREQAKAGPQRDLVACPHAQISLSARLRRLSRCWAVLPRIEMKPELN